MSFGGSALDETTDVAVNPVDFLDEDVGKIKSDDRADVFSLGTAEPTDIALNPDEQVLWGPVLFNLETRPCFLPQCCKRYHLRPSALVTITSCRLVVVQFRVPLGAQLFGLRQRCCKPIVGSVSFVPLRWVLGFRIEEVFSYQKSALTLFLGRVFGCVLTESQLKMKILTNAGLGKQYLDNLTVCQRALPRGGDQRCCFEQQNILDVRRWLGNIALFNADSSVGPDHLILELIKCNNGWAPA